MAGGHGVAVGGGWVDARCMILWSFRFVYIKSRNVAYLCYYIDRTDVWVEIIDDNVYMYICS
jgi:hypothetical protein